MKIRDMQIYAALAALFAKSSDALPPKRPVKHQPSEVAHLSKQERRKRRRIHRLSTRKR
jgi:hypothetical protein